MRANRVRKGRAYPTGRKYASSSQKSILDRYQEQYEKLDYNGRRDKLTECEQELGHIWPGEWPRRKIQKYFDNHRAQVPRSPEVNGAGNVMVETKVDFLEQGSSLVGDCVQEGVWEDGVFSSPLGDYWSLGETEYPLSCLDGWLW
jgi:hypothetical protein